MAAIMSPTSFDDEIVAPDEYICPISLSVMKDPVMSKDGKNFEKRAILDWLNRGNVNCPLTRQPLKPSLLVPNANLRMNIEQWRKENELPEVEDGDDPSFSSENELAFVGFLNVDEPCPSSPRSDQNDDEDEDDDDELVPSALESEINNSVDDDLKDLLDLYNEVLELTSMPFDSILDRAQPPPSNPIPAPTQEETDAALGMIVAQTARRNWLPKLFPKKKSSSS